MALEREDVGAILIYGASVSLLGLATPVMVQALVSTVAFGSVLQPLLVLALMLLVALGFSAALKGLQVWVAEAMQRRLLVRVASDLAHRLPRARLDAWNGSHPPELLNRFFDVFIIQKKSVTLLLGGVEVALTLVVGTLVLALYHPAFLVFDLVLVALVGLLILSRVRKGAETAVAESSAKYALMALFQDMVRHPEAIKLAAGPAWVRSRVDDVASRYIEARSRHFRVLFGQTAGALSLYAVTSAVALGAGGWLVMDRAITLGQLVAAELVVTAIVGALVQLGKYLESFYDLLAAVDKVGYLIDLTVEPDGHEELDLPARPALSMDGVRSDADGEALLQDLVLNVPSGGHLVLTGPDPLGRRRVLELLAGWRQPDAGLVTLGGVDQRDLAAADRARHVMVVVRPALFAGTVFENLTMGDADLTRPDATEALRAVGLGHERLPQGLDTVLGAEGRPLDAGDRVLVVLARAIIARPVLLLLDRTLDGLPEPVLRTACAMLTRPERPWTLAVASDDNRVQRLLGRVMVLRDGRLEEGTA
ncbi:MAG: ABC transporter ATP-binding protein [Candidatus Sericytochromatia bacterium]|nr:ABC transporter ATP-binding protein [Candidatus Sericytochromatia bacterium]